VCRCFAEGESFGWDVGESGRGWGVYELMRVKLVARCGVAVVLRCQLLA